MRQGSPRIHYPRFVLAVLVAAVVDLVYGFIVYGNALAGEIDVNGGVYRSIDGVNNRLPWLGIGLLLAMGAVVSIYAMVHHPNINGLKSGLQFGVLMGVFTVGYIAIGNYVVMKVGRRLTLYMGVAGLLEWTLIGMTIGLIYRPNDKS
jgi:hypothetical protein